MADRPGHSDPVDDPALPAGLVDALGALHRHVEVPRAVDDAILSEARAGYARRRRFWLAARAVGAASAAAAAVVIAIVAVRDREDRHVAPVVTTQGAVSPLQGDIDASGRVDVLDAFLLAKKVQAKATPAGGEDVNGDGVLDRADVDRVAQLAVSVGDENGGRR